MVGMFLLSLLFKILSSRLSFKLFHLQQETLYCISSLLSAIKGITSAYQSLLMFLPSILILISISLSLAFLTIYSIYGIRKISKQLGTFLLQFGIISCSILCSNCGLLVIVQILQFIGRLGVTIPTWICFQIAYSHKKHPFW